MTACAPSSLTLGHGLSQWQSLHSPSLTASCEVVGERECKVS